MIELNEILTKAGLDTKTVMVMRHRPTEPALRRALRTFATERPDLFNAYQCCHGERVENSLERAEFLASFAGHQAGRAAFVGVYRVNGWTPMLGRDWCELETSKELMALGDRGPRLDRSLKLFDLVRTDLLADWHGKLVVAWPPPERAWWRWAARKRNVMSVQAIHDENILVRRMPRWNELVLRWADLKAIPQSWEYALSQWRGIYLIVDRASGKSYVGSAYGGDNLLSRWRSYADTGHGGNVDLKERDPVQFQFAVLQLVSQDAGAEEVIRLENTWKDRLGTREFGLNKN